MLQVVDGNLKQLLNSFLTNWILPLFGVALLIGVVLGVIQNYDKMTDKEGTGTKKEGFINIGWIVGYIVAATAAISGIIALIGQISLYIN